ncbi:cell surface metalloreductase [Microthyrium microscopicum]|uniref:ferric-chelate reductase (NADPH) n=2 Tax=Dothideomycetes TaxID=147541 RepID=A0A6A6UPS0_9PEZI|nr:cell surface metalloreductase [Microthyrium microscopicum]
MDVTQAYAIAAGCGLFCLLLFRTRHLMKSLLKTVELRTSQFLIYPQLVRRHRYLGPWSWAGLLVPAGYIAVNMFCVGFKASSLRVASLRAADLALINLIPAFASLHLNFPADVLGLTLKTYRRFHRVLGAMSCCLLAFHVFTSLASRTPFPLDQMENLWGLIGASSVGLLFLLSTPFLRRLFYEVYLRIHQLLAVLLMYSIWQHLRLKLWPEQFHPPQLYVYISVWTFLVLSLLQFGAIIYRNWPVRSAYSRAYISHVDDTVKIRLKLSRHLRVEPGQYISLWMPTMSFWSFLQSHPFTVTSWAEGKQDSLDLLIEPRGGFTQRLLLNSKAARKAGGRLQPRLALFTGPYGTSASVNRYETVVMVASGFGIAGQLPYLKKLIYGYNTCTTRTRRVHLVWQLETIDIGIAAQSYLNDALTDDLLDDGNILGISIYIKIGKLDSASWGRRAVWYNGSADLRAILQDEMSGKYINRMQGEERGSMLVIASATDEMRDNLREIVRGHLKDKVRLLELEYQPVTSESVASKATEKSWR